MSVTCVAVVGGHDVVRLAVAASRSTRSGVLMLPSVASSVVSAASTEVTPTRPGLLAVGVDADLGVVDLERGAHVAHAGDGAGDVGDGLGLGVELVEVVVAHLDHDGRRVAVGEDAGDEPAGVLERLHAGELAREDVPRAAPRARPGRACAPRGRRTPAGGSRCAVPTLGLTMALRAFCGRAEVGDDHLDGCPWAAPRESALPIALIFAVGVRRARCPARSGRRSCPSTRRSRGRTCSAAAPRSSRWRRPAPAEARDDRRSGTAARGAAPPSSASATPSMKPSTALPRRPCSACPRK